MKTRNSMSRIGLSVAALAFAAYMGASLPASHAAQAQQAAPTAMTSPPGFENLAENLLPTVVNVSTTAKVSASSKVLPQLPDLPPGSPFEQFFKDFYDQYNQQQQQQQQDPDEKVSALGSGFVIDAANGYVVTNNHVIKDADEIKVILQDNTTLDATLVGTDEKTDVAVLKVKPQKGLVSAKWGDSDKAKVGSWVLAIGNPFGLGGTVTAGIVSARQRDINAGPYDDFIQTDASINRGNSGGPMFNMNGEVIGMNTAIFSPSGGSVGIGFAVPSNLARSVVDQLVKFGKTKRGWLGVRIQEVTPEIAESLGLDHPHGALVSSVTPKGPSEAAGIKAGDVITAFNGQSIDQMRHLPLMVAQAEVGKKADVTIWRKNKEEHVQVDLGQLETAEASGILDNGAEKPEAVKPEVKSTDIDNLGLSLAAISDQLRDTYGIPKQQNGAVVTAVKKGGAAEDKGLAPGDVIVEVDQQEVSSPKDVADKVAAAEKAARASVLFFVARKDDMRFVALKLKK